MSPDHTREKATDLRTVLHVLGNVCDEPCRECRRIIYVLTILSDMNLRLCCKDTMRATLTSAVTAIQNKAKATLWVEFWSAK